MNHPIEGGPQPLESSAITRVELHDLRLVIS